MGLSQKQLDNAFAQICEELGYSVDSVLQSDNLFAMVNHEFKAWVAERLSK